MSAQMRSPEVPLEALPLPPSLLRALSSAGFCMVHCTVNRTHGHHNLPYKHHVLDLRSPYERSCVVLLSYKRMSIMQASLSSLRRCQIWTGTMPANWQARSV
eukprot:6203110-Pleurochrysis_carterae.AAC.2